MHKAAYKGDIGELEVLLAEPDADVNIIGAQDRTPLHRAVGGKSDKVIVSPLNHDG
jgi:ankyrin repeat protein